MTIGPNPDFAFLHAPDCVLCAYKNKEILSEIKIGTPIFENDVSEDFEPYDPQKNDYVAVLVNGYLLPNKSNDEVNVDRLAAYETLYWLPVNWLSVVGAGEPVPSDSKFVGSSNGYAVYVRPREIEPQYRIIPSYLHVPPAEDPGIKTFNGDSHFSEFVLAIIEATLQSPEIQKTQKQPPPVTQNLK